MDSKSREDKPVIVVSPNNQNNINNYTSVNGATPWSIEHEELLAEWADSAACFSYVHAECQQKCRRRNICMSLPVIILSTFSGTANFGMGSIFPESFTKANLIIGSFSLIVTLISAISNFLRYAENSEAHKIASVQWAKFQRNITTEISLSPSERTPASEFINLSRKELDRLMEQSPIVDDNVIRRFNKKYPDKKIDFKKPVVFGTIEHTRVYVRNLSMNEFLGNSKDYVSGIDLRSSSKDYVSGLKPNTSSLHNIKIVEDDFLSEDSRE
jgi:hypothetical protein